MPIEIRKDIAKKYELGKSFSLKDGIHKYLIGKNEGSFKSGSLIEKVKNNIVLQNWKEFYSSFNISDLLTFKRELLKQTSRKFNLNKEEEDIFDNLWKLFKKANNYGNSVKDEINDDIKQAYKNIASIAYGGVVKRPTFDRTIQKDDNNFVVFSDMHMTAYINKNNYFEKFNYTLYLNILRTYYANLDYCLVENGDVEECVISEFIEGEANDYVNEINNFPIELEGDNDKWNDFLDIRYKKRKKNLNNIIDKYSDYYELIRTEFIPNNKYVKISGNHDTYLNEKQEKDLMDIIQEEIWGDDADKDVRYRINDILRIKRNDIVSYIITHGHQFDSVCIQHGDVPYAKSLGEVYSECLAWCNEGADRVWELDDTKKWYIGNSPGDQSILSKGNFENVLAKEKSIDYEIDWSNWQNNIENLSDGKGFFETVLGHEIAWEYFENSDSYSAIMLEYWTGDEGIKMRHLNEIDLCEKYEKAFKDLSANSIPKLVLGHTHEPRKNSKDPYSSKTYSSYLNSGSAGRYENLIWCVEINWSDDNNEYQDNICSWSLVDGKLRKTIWLPTDDGKLLVHGPHEYV